MFRIYHINNYIKFCLQNYPNKQEIFPTIEQFYHYFNIKYSFQLFFSNIQWVHRLSNIVKYSRKKLKYIKLVRGVEVESLIFASIAMLIIIPVMYFLPLGFSFRGKLLIIAASLMISLVGLLATPIMSLWQSGMIVVLLIGVSTYFMNGKIPLSGEPIEEESPNNDLNQVNEPVVGDGPDVYSYIASSDLVTNESDVLANESLVEKAMRQNNNRKTPSLFARQSDEEEIDETEMEFISISEVAATNEQLADDSALTHSYLGDMEESLLIEGEEEDTAENNSTVQGDGEIHAPDELVKDQLDMDELDELPELDFNDDLVNENESKEANLDEDFWSNLLEEEEELEVLEEKKEKVVSIK